MMCSNGVLLQVRQEFNHLYPKLPASHARLMHGHLQMTLAQAHILARRVLAGSEQQYFS